jgi:hypothetical protein
MDGVLYHFSSMPDIVMLDSSLLATDTEVVLYPGPGADGVWQSTFVDRAQLHRAACV